MIKKTHHLLLALCLLAAVYCPLLARAEPSLLSSDTAVTLNQAAERLVGDIAAARAAGATVPRIAVVFSGGGAKCSYQVGAIRAVEEKLSEIRKKLNAPNIDIDLVVGTSGGALNALPVALGISALPESLGDFSQVWEELDQIQKRYDRQSYQKQITMVTDRLGHDKRYAIDNAHVQKTLGWKPKISFKQGIHQTIEWYVRKYG